MLSADTIEEHNGAGLVIKSVPSGANVYIDGIARGVTPLNLPSIPEGSYTVRLRKDGYVDRRFKVQIREESRLVVSIDLEEAQGHVFVEIERSPESPPEETLPLRAEIFVDGSAKTGPLLNIPVGYRTILVRAFGWEEVSRMVYVIEGGFQRLRFNLVPAEFRLSKVAARRPRFNPANSGTLGSTELAFEVSAPGRGSVTITNAGGDTVYFHEFRRFEDRAQGIAWNGRSWDGTALPDGDYRALIETESIPWDGSEPVIRRAFVMVAIDSSVQIYPLALSSGKAGLLFTPVPDTLPSGAFQLEGNVLFGRPFTASPEAWRSLPFSAALRFPLPWVEATAALNVTPEFGGGAVSSVAGSFKRRFLKAGDLPLDMAVGFSYGWSAAGAQSPFSLDSGAELFFPLSWRFNGTFSLLVSPAVLWTGEQGYPSEAVPRAVLTGGVLFRRPFISGGVSFRSEFRFSHDALRPGPLLIGAELRLFPPPSNFIINLLGGFWLEGSRRGGFGGAGIGLIW